MAKRRKKVTATPRWLPEREMWRLAVQCNGQRRDFYSPEPGKRGKFECIEKAERWISGDEDLLSDRDPSVRALYAEWLESQSEIVGTSTYSHNDEYGRNYILPAIGHLRISQITNQQQLQSIINKAYSHPVSDKKHLPRSRCRIFAARSCLS